MAKTLERKGEMMPSRFDWFDFDFPDLFRWFEGRRPLGFVEDFIRVAEETKDNTLIIRAEVPGIDPDKDATIELEDGLLRIKVERKAEEREERERGGFRTEFRYGSYARTLRVPKGIAAKDITASYKDGILEVRLPLPAPATTPERVTITRG